MNKKIGKLALRFLFTAAVLGLLWRTIPVAAKSQAPEETLPSDHYTYGIGSVSKMFCTAAVMKLADEKKLDLDAPLINYLPDFRMADQRYRKITPRMLLNHSSGLMGTTFHNAFVYGDTDHYFHDTFLKQLQNQELKADPGEYSVYCNDGFMLAELLVERISGMSFSDYIRKEFSEPLGLKNTLTPNENVSAEKLAPVYYNGFTLPYVNCQDLGSGGIYSTPEDLCRFSQIFMKNGVPLLSDHSLSSMSKPWYLEDKIGASKGDSQTGYGLGWDSVNTYPYSLYGIKALTKSGDVDGYHTGLTVLPEQNLSTAVTSSGGSSLYCEEMVQDIILEVLKEEGLLKDDAAVSMKTVATDTDTNTESQWTTLPAKLLKYAGYYMSKNIMNVELKSNGTLLLTSLDGEYDSVQEYHYTKSGEFVSTKGYYINVLGQLISNANGNKGSARFKFREESNGKTYIIGTIYENTSDLGKAANTLPLAEKIKPQIVSEQIKKEWVKRSGKKYYLTSETYNSNSFFNFPIMKMKLNSQVEGYASCYVKDSILMSSRIIDQNTSKCELDLPGMIGRDLTAFEFYQKHGKEYLSASTMTYVSDETMKSVSELPDDYTVPSKNYASWYRISKKEAASIIKITPPKNGAYYVYDKDDTCIGSSIFKEEPGSVILPADGHIVLTGEKGAQFHIEKVKN